MAYTTSYLIKTIKSLVSVNNKLLLIIIVFLGGLPGLFTSFEIISQAEHTIKWALVLVLSSLCRFPELNLYKKMIISENSMLDFLTSLILILNFLSRKYKLRLREIIILIFIFEYSVGRC